MSKEHPPVPRVILAVVSSTRAPVHENVAKPVAAELQAAGFTFVRTVTVTRERQFIQQLVTNIANANEADAVILIGGVGLGPRHFACEAVDSLVDRRMEGFGEAYRQLLREEADLGPTVFLHRATAGVYNQCVVFAVPRQPLSVERVVKALVIPALTEAVRVATGPG